MKIVTAFLLLVGIAAGSVGSIGSVFQGPNAERQQFIRVEAPVVVLTHVRIIDGTGAAALDDQTIVIAHGKIQSIVASAPPNLPANAQTIDLQGYTALPGLVGMHDHTSPRSGRQHKAHGESPSRG